MNNGKISLKKKQIKRLLIKNSKLNLKQFKETVLINNNILL